MSRTCNLGFGVFSAENAAGINLFDALAHTWDIADVISVELDEDSDLWGIGLNAASEIVGPTRNPAHYAAQIAISPAAPPMRRFLTFLGRCVPD